MSRPVDANKIELGNFEGIRPCRKLPQLMHAVQLNYEEGFFVDNEEGRSRGAAGDYLLFDANGSRSVCRRDVFEDTFTFVKE